METRSEQVVACTLSAADQGKRKLQLEAGLAKLVRVARPIDGGYALCFVDDVLSQCAIDEFVAFERRCCSFMTYRVERREDGLWLEMVGSEGTSQFIEGWLPPDIG